MRIPKFGLVFVLSLSLVGLGIVAFGVVTRTPAAGVKAAMVSQSLAADEYVFTSGSIQLTEDTATFSLVRRTTDPFPDALVQEQRKLELLKKEELTSEFVLSVEDDQGKVLVERPLIERATYHVRPTILAFTELVPFPAGARHLRIKRGKDILAELQPSKSPPEVDVLAPKGGETVDNELVVSW